MAQEQTQQTNPRLILADAAQQQNPNTYDPSQSLMNNAYMATGFDRLVDDLPPQGLVTGTEHIDYEEGLTEDNNGYKNQYQQLLSEMYRDYKSREAEQGMEWHGFQRGMYGSEGLFDNIGTNLQIYSAYALNKIGWDFGARNAASDLQFGIIGTSTRGGNLGLYWDYVRPEELYGEDWREKTPAEMLDHYKKWRIKDVERYYGPPTNTVSEGIGFMTGQLTDMSMVLPTGYLGLTARLAKAGASGLGGKVLASATSAATFGAIDNYMYNHTIEAAKDPNAALVGAAVGGLFGALLPLVGAGASKLLNRFRESNVPLTPNQVRDTFTDELNSHEGIKRTLENELVTAAKNDRPGIQAMIDDIDRRIAANAKAKEQAVEVADTVNSAMKAGTNTTNAETAENAARAANGTLKEDIDYTRFRDGKNRTPETAVENVLSSSEMDGLTPNEAAMVEDYVNKRTGKKPKHTKKEKGPTKEELKAEAEHKAAERAVEQTNYYMDQLSKHGRTYKYNILRHAAGGLGASAIGGGVAGAITGDEDIALQAALASGMITLGAPVARKMYGAYTGRHLLDHPDQAVRITAADNIKSNQIRSWLSGNHPWQHGNVFTTPMRQWERRGGAGKAYAKLHENAEVEFNHIFMGDLVELGNIRARHQLNQADEDIISKMLRGRDVDPALIKEKHTKAKDEVRALYNKPVNRLVESKVLSKERAKELTDNPIYMNRIYHVDAMRSEKGVKALYEATRNTDLTFDDMAQMIQAITGESAKKAREQVTTIASESQGYYSFTLAGLRRLMKKSAGAVAQPSRFIENERTIPDKLAYYFEKAGLLNEDMNYAFLKYAESAAKRHAYAKYFGPNGEMAVAYGKLIEKEWGSGFGFEVKAFEDWAGATYNPANNQYIQSYMNAPEIFKQVNTFVQHWQNSKLMLSAPLNFTQHILYPPMLMAKMGYGFPKIAKTMFKAYNDSFKEIAAEYKRRGKHGQDFLNRTGAMVDSIIYSATGELAAAQPNGKTSALVAAIKQPDIYLRASGFTSVERWNRRVASHVGKAIVEDSLERHNYFKNLTRLTEAQKAEWQDIRGVLLDLGISTEKPLKDITLIQMDAAAETAGGILLDINAPFNQLVETGGQRMSNLTNFRSDYMNKPRFWNHPLGMWFGKFRNFMLHSFNFVGDNVIKPALRGDGTPLATIALLGAPAGIAVNELKEVIRNDNTELSWTQHYLEGLMSMGLLGLWGDGLNQAITHPKNMADFLIGSVYTDAFDTMNAAAGLLTPTPEEIQNAGKDLLESWGVTKNLSGPVTRALGTENPLSNRGERQQEESRLELGLSPFPSL